MFVTFMLVLFHFAYRSCSMFKFVSNSNKFRFIKDLKMGKAFLFFYMALGKNPLSPPKLAQLG
jgi:hypothetical protein